MSLLIPHDRYDIINQLHQLGAIAKKEILDDGVYIQGVIPKRLVQSMQKFAK